MFLSVYVSENCCALCRVLSRRCCNSHLTMSEYCLIGTLRSGMPFVWVQFQHMASYAWLAAEWHCLKSVTAGWVKSVGMNKDSLWGRKFYCLCLKRKYDLCQGGFCNGCCIFFSLRNPPYSLQHKSWVPHWHLRVACDRLPERNMSVLSVSHLSLR